MWTLSWEAAGGPSLSLQHSLFPKASGKMERCPGGPGWPEAEAGEKEGGQGCEHEGREKRIGEKSCDFFLKAVIPQASP